LRLDNPDEFFDSIGLSFLPLATQLATIQASMKEQTGDQRRFHGQCTVNLTMLSALPERGFPFPEAGKPHSPCPTVNSPTQSCLARYRPLKFDGSNRNRLLTQRAATREGVGAVKRKGYDT
jgi:hypothetical protein